MQLINHRYESPASLEAFIASRIAGHRGTLFIQLFSGVTEPAVIAPILELLHEQLPDAQLIGATSAGEIINGRMDSEAIVVAFSLFDATSVRTRYYPHSDFEAGERAAREMVGERTKVCIVLSEGLKSDSESFLEGFASVRNDVLMAGGNAGGDLDFSRTCIMEGNRVYDEGVVVAALEGDRLQVHNAYSLYWTPVGKEMTITRSENNVVYEIDHMPVEELYIHYLGAASVAQIPASAVEFPLIKEEEGVQIARSLIGRNDAGGFIYAGHFHEGERVRFAIGNVEEVLAHSVDIRDRIASHPVEATYIYSCLARKIFLKEQLNQEFGLIESVAPTAGFFTYGEFFHAASANRLLNITTTTLSLSESEQLPEKVETAEQEQNHSMLKSLTHLVNTTQGELDASITFLDQYKMVLDESSIVSKTDVAGLITYVNDAFCEVSGFSREELIGQKHSIVRHPDNPPELFDDLWRTISGGEVWKGTFKNLAKNGSPYYVKSVIAPVFDDEGRVVEYIAARVDVTELIAKEQIIRRQRRDALTALKNRTSLLEDLESDAGREHMLVLLNIDRFSDVNDYFGYEVGDGLLKGFASRFAGEIGHDAVYRISGDEFALVCSSAVFDSAARERIVTHLDRLAQHKYEVGDYEISVNLSCGAAFGQSKELYKLAHMALKAAKEQGEKIVFYNDDEALAERTRANILMTDTIKSAIEEDRIVPYFQGIADNRTQKIVKYESLIRMIGPDGKVISPFFFLEQAKRSKLYDRLTRIMIAKSFETFEMLEYEFSINLTLQDILSTETRDCLFERLERSSASNRLVLEIVESEGIERFDEVATFIKDVKAYGCKIAIDDFGTGYSNFSYLTKLDVDYIKIDGSLIKDITTEADHLITVESIMLFAKKKGIATIAEFVEDETVYAKLVELGVDYSQGYHFSIPTPEIRPS